MPRSARNSALSSASRSAISASSAAQIATTGAPSFAAARARAASSSGLSSKPCSATFATYIVGFIVSRKIRLQQRALLVVEVDGARGPRLVQRRRRPSSARRTMRCASLSPPARASFSTFDDLLVDRREIGERELGVDRLDVGRPDRPCPPTCTTLSILEAAHDVRDRIGLADVGEELVAEALALRRAGDEPRDVDELDGRGNHLLRLRDRRERGEPRVGHFDDADVRLDRAERIVLRGDARLGQRVEQRRLADVGQPDDAAAANSCSPFRSHCRALRAAACATPASRAPCRPPRCRGHASSARPIAASIAARSAASAAAARSRRPPARGTPNRADGRCRAAAARSRRCRDARGCRAGRCARRCRRPASASPRPA